MDITTIGFDIAKGVFQVHGVDSAGEVVLRRRLSSGQLLSLFERLSPCLVGDGGLRQRASLGVCYFGAGPRRVHDRSRLR